jgi:hypothetical protein
MSQLTRLDFTNRRQGSNSPTLLSLLGGVSSVRAVWQRGVSVGPLPTITFTLLLGLR